MEFAHHGYDNNGKPVYNFVDSFHGTLIRAKIDTGSETIPFRYAFGSLGSLVRYYKNWLAGQKKKDIPKTHLAVFKRLVPEAVDLSDILAKAPGYGAEYAAYAEHDAWCKGAGPPLPIVEAAAKHAPPKPAPKDVDFFNVVPGDTTIEPLTKQYKRRDWVNALAETVGGYGGFRIHEGEALFYELPDNGYRSENNRAAATFNPEFKVYGNVAHVRVKPSTKATPFTRRSAKGKEPVEMDTTN
jgi:hypothetical protein